MIFAVHLLRYFAFKDREGEGWEGVCCRSPFYGLAGRKSMKKKTPTLNRQKKNEVSHHHCHHSPIGQLGFWLILFNSPTIRLVKSPGF